MNAAFMSYQLGDGAAAGTYHQSRQRAKNAGTPAAAVGTCASPLKINFS